MWSDRARGPELSVFVISQQPAAGLSAMIILTVGPRSGARPRILSSPSPGDFLMLFSRRPRMLQRRPRQFPCKFPVAVIVSHVSDQTTWRYRTTLVNNCRLVRTSFFLPPARKIADFGAREFADMSSAIDDGSGHSFLCPRGQRKQRVFRTFWR